MFYTLDSLETSNNEWVRRCSVGWCWWGLWCPAPLYRPGLATTTSTAAAASLARREISIFNFINIGTVGTGSAAIISMLGGNDEGEQQHWVSVHVFNGGCGVQSSGGDDWRVECQGHWTAAAGDGDTVLHSPNTAITAIMSHYVLYNVWAQICFVLCHSLIVRTIVWWGSRVCCCSYIDRKIGWITLFQNSTIVESESQMEATHI